MRQRADQCGGYRKSAGRIAITGSKFERVSGVAIVRECGWYGARRVGADLAEDVESDGRALYAITGHQSDETRRKVYQEKRRNTVIAKAATAREAARQTAIEAARSDRRAPADMSAAPSHWEQMQEAKKERRRAKHPSTGDARRQATYPPKPCTKCGTDFVPSGPNSRACETCSPRRVRPAKSGV
jgi:hypothetical protein